MNWIGTGILIFSGVLLLLWGITRIDREHGMNLSPAVGFGLSMGSIIAGWICAGITKESSFGIYLAWMIICIYFLSCAVTDFLTCQVYDVFQYIGIHAAAYLALSKTDQLTEGISFITVGGSLILFSLLQYFLFMKLYGKADGMAFLIAAMAEGSLGYDIKVYLLHMIIGYLLLCLIQGLKGNIGKGRLKTPVPFVPYIWGSFLVILVFGKELQRML